MKIEEATGGYPKISLERGESEVEALRALVWASLRVFIESVPDATQEERSIQNLSIQKIDQYINFPRLFKLRVKGSSAGKSRQRFSSRLVVSMNYAESCPYRMYVYRETRGVFSLAVDSDLSSHKILHAANQTLRELKRASMQKKIRRWKAYLFGLLNGPNF